MEWIGGWLRVGMIDWLTGLWVEHQAELCKGAAVITAMTTNITNPGGKIRYGDHFLSNPGNKSDQAQALLTGLAAVTWLS